MTAQIILKMIEQVDPADTAKLDEIDARVWCFVKKVKYKKHGRADTGLWVLYSGNWNNLSTPLYTRSRNALKAIRPECPDGFYVGENTAQNFIGARWVCWINSGSDYNQEFRGDGKTEELAELHAVIQAIDHERGRE